MKNKGPHAIKNTRSLLFQPEKKAKADVGPPPEDVEQLVAFGFTPHQVRKGLQHHKKIAYSSTNDEIQNE